MSFRKVSAARGAAWITEGLAIFKANPTPYLSLCLLVGLLSSLRIVSMIVGLFGVVFYGGMVSALHTQAQGGVPQVTQAFDGFSRPGAFGRLIVIVLLNIAMAVFALILLAIAIGPMVIELIRQGSDMKPDEAMLLTLLPRLGVVLLILFPVGIFVGWITLLAVPRAMLDEVPGMQAVREAISVIFANFSAMLVNLLCLFALMLIMIIVLMIPMFFINMLSINHAFFGMLLQVPIMTIFTGAIFAIYGSIMYQAWRDIYGGETTKVSLPNSMEA